LLRYLLRPEPERVVSPPRVLVRRLLLPRFGSAKDRSMGWREHGLNSTCLVLRGAVDVRVWGFRFSMHDQPPLFVRLPFFLFTIFAFLDGGLLQHIYLLIQALKAFEHGRLPLLVGSLLLFFNEAGGYRLDLSGVALLDIKLILFR